MKKLFVLRHGAAENYTKGDKTRNLTSIGGDQVERVTQKLRAKSIKFDLIITSSANRARQTANIISDKLNFSSQAIVTLDELYLADVQTIYDVLSKQPGSIQNLLIVGHNPGFSEFCSSFSRNSCNMSTASLIALEFSNDWQDIFKAKPAILFKLQP